MDQGDIRGHISIESFGGILTGLKKKIVDILKNMLSLVNYPAAKDGWASCFIEN